MITALIWCERLLGLAVFFQSLELLKLKPIWIEAGIWRWSQVRRDYEKSGNWIMIILDFFLRDKRFEMLLNARLALSILIWFYHPAWLVGFLFFSTWLISIRWRGFFNGGSDSMTCLIALALWIAQTFKEQLWVLKACLGFIAIHITLSYFMAGVVKLRNLEWRKGLALKMYFGVPRYDSPPDWIRHWANHPVGSMLIAWLVIILECAFPLAWIHPMVCLAFLCLAFSFHILNFYTFGLNRFVFIWLAGYPALYAWVSFLS